MNLAALVKGLVSPEVFPIFQSRGGFVRGSRRRRLIVPIQRDDKEEKLPEKKAEDEGERECARL